MAIERTQHTVNHLNQHPGSTKKEISEEPDWTQVHNKHRVGFKTGDYRYAGLVNEFDEDEVEEDFTQGQKQKAENEGLQKEVHEGKLISVRDVVEAEKDFHLIHPSKYNSGARFRLNVSEDWIKGQAGYKANIEKKKKAQESKEKSKAKENSIDNDRNGNTSSDSSDESSDDKKHDGDENKAHSTGKEDDKNVVDNKDEGYHTNSSNESDQSDHEDHNLQEHQMRKKDGSDGNKHHDARGHTEDDEGKSKNDKSEQDHKYTSKEHALLRILMEESKYMASLEQNDGNIISPQKDSEQIQTIDEEDQFGPDNWIPRAPDLIRLTGKHPLNAEPQLSKLFSAGLITPNELHYVRNHGAVPFIQWETHQLEIGDHIHNDKSQTVHVFSMDDIKNKFRFINIPVALACDGNRRKELNLIRRSKGFNWGSGAVSCAYWKGCLVRDVLSTSGLNLEKPADKIWWVHFEGTDDLQMGKYATSIPFEYVMDFTNDVILAYEMNNQPLPPDHGFPLRLIIPGYVGGRCVKWLKKIWISEEESQNHYHIWDNRVLPEWITEKDGEFAEAAFKHPDTACNEQNLNSVICKPAQNETLGVCDLKAGKTYRIEGYAYDGGGHKVQKVEVSLDEGKSWLYSTRKFPDKPIRHGKKFWAWLHWHVDVEQIALLQAKSITVRCFNVFKNTQPQMPNWNLMGMMNNSWYIVKLKFGSAEDGNPIVIFQHPVEPGTGGGGWMQPSTEIKLREAQQSSGTPSKQFTREEIEKHDSEKDCWIVVNGSVYDVTSVLSWHPGGAHAITSHAGKVHLDTSEEFSSIHDDYATQKLQECIIGIVTEKVQKFISNEAEKAAKEKAESSKNKEAVLLKHRWTAVTLQHRENLSADSRKYVFKLPTKAPLNLETGNHILLGFHLNDKMVVRSYTPTKPIMPSDENGTFELVIKTYFPDEKTPGGTMSNVLDILPIGESIDIKGPTGDIVYKGNGEFAIEGRKRNFDKIVLILGGTGVTPGYQLIHKILASEGDSTQIRCIYANKNESDILLREELDGLAKTHSEQFQLCHVLSRPSDDWKGKSGHVTEDIIKENGFEPQEGAAVFMCGPPPLIQKAVLPALRDWGYNEDDNIFGF